MADLPGCNLVDGQAYPATIKVDSDEHDSQNKLKAFRSLAKMPDYRYPDGAQRPNSQFDFRWVVTEQPPGAKSRSVVERWYDTLRRDELAVAQATIETHMETLRDDTHLTAPQKDVINSMLHGGVPACTLLLSGLYGCGKSGTLANTIFYGVPIKCKFGVFAQSNAGVDAMLEALTIGRTLEYLQELAPLRVYRVDAEGDFEKRLRVDRNNPKVPPNWKSIRIFEYANAYLGDEASRNFLAGIIRTGDNATYVASLNAKAVLSLREARD